MPRTYRRKTDRRYASHRPQDVPASYEPGFLARLDQRTEIARLLRERFDAISADLGGDLSGIKASLLERFVFLEATLGKLEAQIATAADAATTAAITARWIQGVNALLGVAKTLGIDRHDAVISALYHRAESEPDAVTAGGDTDEAES